MKWIFKWSEVTGVTPSEEIDPKERESKRLGKYSKAGASPWTTLKGERYIQWLSFQIGHINGSKAYGKK